MSEFDSSRPKGHYYLVGQTPVLATNWEQIAEGGRDFRDQIVKLDRVFGICWVSTRFMGLDMRSGIGPPLLFETMAFWRGQQGEEEWTRCTTWAEAEEMHRAMVRQVSRPSSVLQYVLRWFRRYWKEAREDWLESWRKLQRVEEEEEEDPDVECADPWTCADPWKEAVRLMKRIDRRGEEHREKRDLERFGG